MESLLALNVRNARLLPESELDTLNVIITIANFLSGNALYFKKETFQTILTKVESCYPRDQGMRN